MKSVFTDDAIISRLLKLTGLIGNKFLFLNASNEVEAADAPGTFFERYTGHITPVSATDTLAVVGLQVGTMTPPNSIMQVTGSQANTMRVQTTSSTTLDATDYILICDSTAGVITVNLPTAVGITGRTYWIRLWSGLNDVTIEPAGTENILGSTGSFLNMALANDGDWVMLISDGADWRVVASNPTV